MNRTLTRFTLFVAIGGLLAVACGDDTTTEGGEEVTTAAALANYADIVHASYLDSHTTAVALKTAVDALVAAPSADTMEAARQAWLDSRLPYLQTEVYRFYDGPIDHPEDGPEGLLNAWPLDESHIDDIVAGSDEITADFLESQNETPNEDSISVGYHAVEYLLWGADTSADGPGDRPFSDYVDADNADRRASYLTISAGLIVAHLENLVADWDANTAGNYRESFLAAGDEEGLRRVMTGMVVLSGFETGGERLQTALDTGLQEDEHSCFSDNTHVDMIQDVQGIQNVWLGSYKKLDGTVHTGASIHAVVAASDADLAAKIEARIAESLALANALPVPFDQAIVAGNAGNAAVQALIDSLFVQRDDLEEAFRLFNLEIPQPE